MSNLVLSLEPLYRFLILLALIGFTIWFCLSPIGRRWIGQIVGSTVDFYKSASARAASVIDWFVPLSIRNEEPSTRWLWALVAVNLSPLAAYFFADAETSIYLYTTTIVVVSVLIFFNFFMLSAAYWALKEEDALMNLDMPWSDKIFGNHYDRSNISTARNIPILTTVFFIFLIQLALLITLIESKAPASIVSVSNSTGFSLLDNLTSLLNALPGISLFVSIASLDDAAKPVAPYGTIFFALLKLFGSAIIIAVALGLVQRHNTCRRLVRDYVERTQHEQVSVALKEKLKKSPSLIKHYIRDAFMGEADPKRLQKLIDAAIVRHSYGFPSTFIKRYRNLDDLTRSSGSRFLADFIKDKGHQFDSSALEAIFEAARSCWAERGKILHASPEYMTHRANIGHILLPALEMLFSAEATEAIEDLRSRRVKILNREPVQRPLRALAYTTNDTNTRDRIFAVLNSCTSGRSTEEIVHVLEKTELPLKTELIGLLGKQKADSLEAARIILSSMKPSNADLDRRLKIVNEMFAQNNLRAMRLEDGTAHGAIIRLLDKFIHEGRFEQSITSRLTALKRQVIESQNGYDPRRAA